MRQLLAIFLVLFMLVACGAAAIVILAGGWVGVESESTTVLDAPPTVAVVAPDGLPTLPALPPAEGSDAAAPGGVGAAGGAAVPGATGGFNGAFSGTLITANGTSAPATLTLTQTGGNVTGQVEIGPGLTIDAGTCGSQAVPELVQSVAAAVDPAAPNRIQSVGGVPVGGFNVGVVLTADLAPDGQSVAARADLDLPFLCGRDPSISGTFTRQ